MSDDTKKILAKLEQHDKKFDAINAKFKEHEFRLDNLTDMVRLDRIEETMATKDDIRRLDEKKHIICKFYITNWYKQLKQTVGV